MLFPAHTRDLDLVINEPADGLAPGDAKPSVGSDD